MLYSEGYDTTRSFRNELNGYRNQLAENYLTDTQTKEKLLQKAYQRSLTEINAWHILIAIATGCHLLTIHSKPGKKQSISGKE